MKKNILHTDFCDMFGIKYPIVLSGMGFVSGAALAAAVSNAGGLGIIGTASFTPDELREVIKRCKDLTDKPFGVDAPIPTQLKDIPPDADEETLRSFVTEEQWEFAREFGEEFGIPKGDGKALLQAFSFKVVKEWFDIALEEKIPVFVSAVGNPDWLIVPAHDNGMKVMSCIGLVRQARKDGGQTPALVASQNCVIDDGLENVRVVDDVDIVRIQATLEAADLVLMWLQTRSPGHGVHGGYLMDLHHSVAPLGGAVVAVEPAEGGYLHFQDGQGFPGNDPHGEGVAKVVPYLGWKAVLEQFNGPVRPFHGYEEGEDRRCSQSDHHYAKYLPTPGQHAVS